MFCLKDFDEPYGATVKARLAHLEPHLSTRLGTALRHAGAEIAVGAQPSQADPGAHRRRTVRHRRRRSARPGRGCAPRRARLCVRAASTSSASRSIRPAPAPARPCSAAASTCRCGVWKICRRGSPSFISVWRGADCYLRRRAGGTPTAPRTPQRSAASSPRASAPPLAARIRPPIPASFGSFECRQRSRTPRHGFPERRRRIAPLRRRAQGACRPH